MSMAVHKEELMIVKPSPVSPPRESAATLSPGPLMTFCYHDLCLLSQPVIVTNLPFQTIALSQWFPARPLLTKS